MEVAFALVFGLLIGSFLNVCILRLPAGRSVTLPRSRCPQCNAIISWYDNIPLVSYVMLRGRCRHCGAAISPRYALVEAATGAISVLLYLKFDFSPEWAVYLGFCGALLVLAFIDIDHRILPDPITLNGIWVGIIATIYLAPPNPFVSRILRWLGIDVTNPRLVALIGSLLGIIIGGGLLWGVAEAYLRLRGIEGMGFGDVKMMAMVGAFLGAPLTLLTIMLGSLVGSIVGLLFIRFAGKGRDYELPFGTFLSVGAIVAVLYGEDLIRMYLNRMFPPPL